MLYTMFAAGAMGSFAELYGQLQRTLGATHRVRELLEETPEAVDPVIAPSPLGGNGSGVRGSAKPQAAPRIRGDVEFAQVSFRYPSRPEVEVLRDVCLT